MAGRRRGARTGRGWDAAPPRARASTPRASKQQQRSTPAVVETTDPAERAREICLRELAIRPRTRAELASALRRGGISDQVAAEVLDRYDEVGMIDDAAFARAWVSSRHHGRGLARRALASELRQRGVAADDVDQALSQLDGETEAATARALVERKLRTTTGRPEVVFRRLVGMLARKGYPAGVALQVVKEAMAAHSAEMAELAEQIDPDAVEPE